MQHDAPPELSEEATPDVASEGEHHGSLRGTFVAVVMMAAFFVLTWFGTFLIAMDRR